MAAGDTYYVWKRCDGFVSTTTYDPTRMNHTANFEILGQFNDWYDARELIVEHRIANPNTAVSSNYDGTHTTCACANK